MLYFAGFHPGLHLSKVPWTVTHKMLVRISNQEDPDQTASSEAV